MPSLVKKKVSEKKESGHIPKKVSQTRFRPYPRRPSVRKLENFELVRGQFGDVN